VGCAAVQGFAARLRALSPHPAALRAATFPLQGKVGNIVTFSVTILLTMVPDSVTYDSSRSLEGRLPEASRKVERVRCPRVVLHAALGRLGYQPPGMMTGMGGAPWTGTGEGG
jgi:hypothetical protein